ncbi:AAA family ATPase [Rahnella aceris]|uniref:AAA family ATPase n=1 Tax=Rahnella sp. (strain Y9602) TaxID=2703885 RepID=A0ABW6C791_RAHSY|nr:ATPase [Rahnella aquatilis HX2]
MATKTALEEVFKLSGAPTFTFVEPNEYKQLLVSIRTKGRGVIIEGPSGIGKTTCVLNIINKLEIDKPFTVLSGRKSKDKEAIEKILVSESFGGVIIDDFHKLDGELKSRFSDLLKTLADEESEDSKLIIIGINKTGKSLMEFSTDLRNRISIIKFESNPEEKVRELISKGETALNFSLNIKEDIVKDSRGSFHIAQMLAHHACLSSDILESCDDTITTSVSYESLKETVLADLDLSYSDIVTSFVKGQRVKKGSRAPYLHVLYWLALADDWSINLQEALMHNTTHKNSVGQILSKGHLNSHFESEPRFSTVIYFNSDTSEVSIEDPKFSFYLSNILWSKLARKIGFFSFDFKPLYDYALSFAGANRADAKYIHEKLSENEISVFYDNNEQARILSQDVESYLAPIYRSESVYVIPFLSKDYPNRIWCKFEGDNFEARFGSNSVIPLRYTDAPAGMFDNTNKVGGFTLDVTKPLNEQLDEFVDLLINKIHERRIEDAENSAGLDKISIDTTANS